MWNWPSHTKASKYWQWSHSSSLSMSIALFKIGLKSFLPQWTPLADEPFSKEFSIWVRFVFGLGGVLWSEGKFGFSPRALIKRLSLGGVRECSIIRTWSLVLLENYKKNFFILFWRFKIELNTNLITDNLLYSHFYSYIPNLWLIFWNYQKNYLNCQIFLSSTFIPEILHDFVRLNLLFFNFVLSNFKSIWKNGISI